MKLATETPPVPLLDLAAQYRTIRDDLDRALHEVVESQRFVLGPVVEDLERAITELTGSSHAIGCASGTDALLLPLKLLANGEVGEVIVPAFTFFATAGAVWNAGLRPVFCDVDPTSFNVTADLLEQVWTEQTIGVVPVHLFGQMAPMDPIMKLAETKGAWVLEDAAQAIGATQRDAEGSYRAAGAVGAVGAFSFFPTKNLGGFGDGGMITTDDDALAARLKAFRVHGGVQMYHHEVVGTNSRLDALQAAVLLAKLPHLEAWTAARRQNAERYEAGLSDVSEVILPTVEEGNTHVFNQYTVKAEARDELRAFLTTRTIGSGVYYPVPLHQQECFAELGYGEGDFPVSERLSREVVSLPVSPELTAEQSDIVISAIREFYGI